MATDLNEATITAAVLEQFARTPDARTKRLVTALVRHLHAFVREVEPSFDEWAGAIDFLTRTGRMCDAKRQEFILLSDVLGVSMLVDAINHRMPAGATETTVLGPFFVEAAPEMPNGSDIAAGLPGEKLHVSGRVTSVAGAGVAVGAAAGGGMAGGALAGGALAGAALAGATVDVWHADDGGFYDVQRADLDGPALRARLRTDAHGRFDFWSVQPVSYPIPHDGPVGALLTATNRHPFRPAHVHFMIAAEGHETLVTHVFVAGDAYLDSDAVFGVKASLIRAYERHPPGAAPGGRRMAEPWRSLQYDFALKPV